RRASGAKRTPRRSPRPGKEKALPKRIPVTDPGAFRLHGLRNARNHCRTHSREPYRYPPRVRSPRMTSERRAARPASRYLFKRDESRKCVTAVASFLTFWESPRGSPGRTPSEIGFRVQVVMGLFLLGSVRALSINSVVDTTFRQFTSLGPG